MTELVLASSSPRRQSLLKELGIDFVVDAPNVDETPLKGEKPLEYVKRVARDKAMAVAKNHKGRVVLAGDTAGALGRKILGKPENTEDAANMIRFMAGKRHKIISTVCVVDKDGQLLDKTVVITVKMKPMAEKEIQAYVAKQENWHGKSGAYGIQTAAGGALLTSINGSHSGVVGLPLVETVNLLKRVGLEL